MKTLNEMNCLHDIEITYQDYLNGRICMEETEAEPLGLWGECCMVGQTLKREFPDYSSHYAAHTYSRLRDRDKEGKGIKIYHDYILRCLISFFDDFQEFPAQLFPIKFSCHEVSGELEFKFVSFNKDFMSVKDIESEEGKAEVEQLTKFYLISLAIDSRLQ